MLIYPDDPPNSKSKGDGEEMWVGNRVFIPVQHKKVRFAGKGYLDFVTKGQPEIELAEIIPDGSVDRIGNFTAGNGPAMGFS